MLAMFLLPGALSFAGVALAKGMNPSRFQGLEGSTKSYDIDFHYGAAFNVPFNTSTDCVDINNISPELLINWGPDNRDDASLNVCNNADIKFVPNLWGRTWDDTQLSALPDDDTPWGVIFENEPNWWGSDLNAEHGVGANMTAKAAAARYGPHTQIINEKWGVGKVKLISPSPVHKAYPNCTTEPEANCAFQPQLAWLDEYFANCGTCYHDIWAINLHDYSCHLANTQSVVADLNAHYPGKNIFFGELGCGSRSAEAMAQYLTEFIAWAYTAPTIVGFIWAGINDVGTPGSELSLNGQLQPVGQVFKTIQQDYPPISLPISGA